MNWLFNSHLFDFLFSVAISSTKRTRWETIPNGKHSKSMCKFDEHLNQLINPYSMCKFDQLLRIIIELKPYSSWEVNYPFSNILK